jgi:hypothetical protein
MMAGRETGHLLIDALQRSAGLSFRVLREPANASPRSE